MPIGLGHRRRLGAAVVLPGPFILWTCNETALPHVNTGTGGTLDLAAGTGTSTSNSGRLGNARGFPGTASIKSVSTTVGNSNSVTVAFWMYPRIFAQNAWVVAKAANASWTVNPPCGIRLGDATGIFVAVAVTTTGANAAAVSSTMSYSATGTIVYATGGNATKLTAYTWQHIAMTYDATTGYVRLYKDGVFVVQAYSGATAALATSSGPWAVGGNAIGSEMCNAIIDEINVYSVVLSDAQIAALVAQAGAPPDAVPTFSTTALSLSTIERWSAAQTITVSGGQFDPACTVYIGATALTTTYVSSASVTAVVPDTLLYEVATLSVTVRNPGPVTSNAQTFTVTQPSWVHLEIRPDMGRTMDGTNVRILADQSGKGDSNRNLSQLNTSLQLQYNAGWGVYNSKDGLASLGAGRRMRSGVWTTPLAQPYRTYFVGAAATSSLCNVWDGAAATNRTTLSNHYSATSMAYGVTGTGGGSSLTMVTIAVDHCIVVAEANGASSKFARNTKSFGYTGSTGNGPFDGFSLFSAYDDSLAANAPSDFTRMIVIDSSTITTAQHGRIMDYLGSHYGITVTA